MINRVEDRMIEMLDRKLGLSEPTPIPGLFASLFEHTKRPRRIVRRTEAGLELEPA